VSGLSDEIGKTHEFRLDLQCFKMWSGFHFCWLNWTSSKPSILKTIASATIDCRLNVTMYYNYCEVLRNKFRTGPQYGYIHSHISKTSLNKSFVVILLYHIINFADTTRREKERVL
jgi:hypothetical protein